MRAIHLALTPDAAREMLQKNTLNRPISQSNVRYLSKEMREKHWRFNGEPIIISEDGVLLNGQHRLLACIDSGETIETLVLEGIPKDTFHTMDAGRPRKGSDILAIQGEKNYTKLTSALRHVESITVFNGSRRAGKLSPTDLRELLQMHAPLRLSVEFVSHIYNLSATPPITVSLSAAMHYLFALKDRPLADTFIEKLLLGINLTTDDVVYKLRRRLCRDVEKNAKLDRQYQYAVIIKAWNSLRSNAPLKVIRWSTDPERGEDFPRIL